MLGEILWISGYFWKFLPIVEIITRGIYSKQNKNFYLHKAYTENMDAEKVYTDAMEEPSGEVNGEQ